MNTGAKVGPVGFYTVDVPMPVTGVPDIARIQTSQDSACVIAQDGPLYCWGNVFRPRPVAVAGLADATAIRTGSNHACAVRASGALSCWGERRIDGGNGYYGFRQADTNRPEDRYGIADAIAVASAKPSARLYAACAVRLSGEVLCFGRDLLTHKITTVRPGVADATAVAVGEGHACALRKGGGVACWGDGEHPRLASGYASPEAVATEVKDAIAIAAGGNTSCAVRRGGKVVCWGSNEYSLLGNGSSEEKLVRSDTPTVVRGLGDAVSISLENSHACAVRRSGQVVCWGYNTYGVAESEATVVTAPTPTRVFDAIAVDAGSEGSCAVRRSGVVTCWGMYNDKRGGPTVKKSYDEYTDVPDLKDAVAVSLGNEHACALRKGGQVLCWGDNTRGQIGDGTGLNTPTLFARP
jgi:alpha-tubulin suppressor-like RCC1 family protein